MKKITFFSLSVITFFVMLNINLHSQQCEVRVTDITYESANSLTFDVYLKNFGTSNFIYSHGSLAWTIDPTFLNGGMPTFSLVPGYSDFIAGAQPPSALINSPNILRTSSNMPGSNGTILPGQSLRLYRFRLQTSASSFASNNFSLSWKNSVTPYTRLFNWNTGTGLPDEISGANLQLFQFLFEENFDYAVGDSLNGLNGWVVQPTASYVNKIKVVSPGLTYPGYPSVSGNAAKVDTTGQDIYHAFTSQSSGSVYAAILVNISKVTTTGDYFFHFTQTAGSTTFKGRVYAKLSGGNVSFGLLKGSNGSAIYTTSTFTLNTTHLIVLKYKFNSVTSTDDSVFLFINPAIGGTEPTPDLSFGHPTDADYTMCGVVNLRQGTAANAPRLILDGIRVGTSWSDILPVTGSPILSVTPSTLSGFSYTLGGGPSTSQSYSLSGTDLNPLSGSISVAGSTNYEVSTDNVNFSSGFSVGYTSGTLAATTIHVRLKSGLAGGVYNSENISNSGGGATTANVVCSGAVLKQEPTNHVTSFTGILGNPTYHFINLSWIDATGTSIPDGYLIKASNVGFASILDPVDGTAEVNSYLVQNVAQGLQAYSYGLHSDSTYYFKIYPYTNSGTSINYKIDGSVPQFTITTAVPPSLPITENFEYSTGSALTVNGWVAHSGAGTNPILVNATPLSYTGYVNSGLGKSVSLLTSGEDDNRAFGSITSNSIYASFMVNVTSAQTAGEYFFHFAPENSTTLYFGKVFVKKNAGDSLAFGVSKNVNSATALYTPFSYSLNTTYLLVVKYTFNTGTTDDDEVKLWINPILNGTEPPSNLTQTDAGTDALSLGMFALRQGAVANTPTLILGGLRVADTWVPGSSPTTFPLSVSVTNGWNMVSVPGLHPTNQNVLTWWPLKDPAANVFKFVPGTGYDTTTTVTPGKGYWLKNLGAYTYTYPAIQIVAHDPINGSAGWNMIGGYEQNVLTSGITTNPPGLINAIVYGYRSDSGYVRAYDIVRGKGYWIKLSASGQIIIPSLLAKGTSKIAITNTKEWGRIIITDNAGRSYTLYAVKGGVNLNDYELPPPAPAGMFDVRYSSGRYAEELSAANQIIEMNGMEYPVRVGVENANIRLQDETGKINERMKPGEEVVINSNMISKLLVSTDIIPDKYSLEQNYPNPFNPSTRIEFSIPEDVNNVTLTIYDALGQRVAELVNTKMEAGKYSYVWNASNVATGLYIYELRTDKFVSVKKMMLLK